jgi:hypothetical protein
MPGPGIRLSPSRSCKEVASGSRSRHLADRLANGPFGEGPILRTGIWRKRLCRWNRLVARGVFARRFAFPSVLCLLVAACSLTLRGCDSGSNSVPTSASPEQNPEGRPSPKRRGLGGNGPTARKITQAVEVARADGATVGCKPQSVPVVCRCPRPAPGDRAPKSFGVRQAAAAGGAVAVFRSIGDFAPLSRSRSMPLNDDGWLARGGATCVPEPHGALAPVALLASARTGRRTACSGEVSGAGMRGAGTDDARWLHRLLLARTGGTACRKR